LINSTEQFGFDAAQDSTLPITMTFVMEKIKLSNMRKENKSNFTAFGTKRTSRYAGSINTVFSSFLST